MNELRYQHAPWYVKLWRRRWYAYIPIEAFKLWWIDQHTTDPWGPKFWWGTAVGSAQMRMNWVYAFDELDDHS